MFEGRFKKWKWWLVNLWKVKELEKQGHEVVNTIFSEEAPKNSKEAVFYLAKSIEAMSKVDAVVFMRGWELARGCRIEHKIAKEYGIFIKELED